MNNKNYPNLKSWKKGQSGNPDGRKQGSKNVSTIVRKLLEQDAKDGLLSSADLTELANGKPTSSWPATGFLSGLTVKSCSLILISLLI